MRVRSSNQFYFKQSKKVSQYYSEDIRNYAIEIVQKCSKLQEELIDIEELSNLQKIEGIDPGEAMLTLAAIVEALAGATQIEPIKTKLLGRIICLEQTIKATIVSQGFEVILSKVLPGRKCDRYDEDKVSAWCFPPRSFALKKYPPPQIPKAGGFIKST